MKKIDAIFYEVEDMIDLQELSLLLSSLPSNFYALDMFAVNGNHNVCYVFISADMAEELNYDYLEIIYEIQRLMNNMELEKDSQTYEHDFQCNQGTKTYKYLFIKNAKGAISCLKEGD